MAYRLGRRSRKRLRGVHPDLVAVVKRAIKITAVDFTVLEGVRTRARQRRLVRSGASKTMNSRHLTGHAVDLGAWVDGTVSWHWGHYFKIADAMKKAAAKEGIEVKWGGSWKMLSKMPARITARDMHRRFPDGPHYQLSWRKYPK